MKYNIYGRSLGGNMEKLKFYILKYKYIIITLILFIILITLWLYFENNNKKEKVEVVEPQILYEENSKEKDNTDEEEIAKIKVDIKGYVKKSGVYELNSNSRVIDAINMAGGLKEGANTINLNLSKKLVDENVIIVYSNSEIEALKDSNKVVIEYECDCPDVVNDACINQNDVVNEKEDSNNKDDKKTEELEKDELISINTGSVEDLMKLNGIGESKAKAIIEYRNKNGLFKNLEDIMNVSGIGESAYSKIKDHIKL